MSILFKPIRVKGSNARGPSIFAWITSVKPNHRLPVPAFKVGKTDYLTVEYAVEQNQNTGYKNILKLKLTGKKGNKFYITTQCGPRASLFVLPGAAAILMYGQHDPINS